MDVPALVLEFFLNPHTLPDRKAYIEQTLTEFKSRPDAYRLALPFLADTTDPHVAWFGLSVYEGCVSKWSQIDAGERRELRSLFWNKLTSNHNTMPPFLLNKMVKLVVDIAKQEFPNEDPDFFVNIYALQLPSLSLCLTMLKIVAEEFSQSGRQDVPAARKRELDILLKQQVSNILAIAVDVLARIYQSLLVSSSTSTPAGSPSEAAFAGGMSLYSPLKLPDGTSFPHVGISPTRPRNSPYGHDMFVHGGRISSENATTSGLALEVIQTLFAFIPLEQSTSTYLPNTMDMLFKFSQLNDDSTVALGTLAIACLNELMARNYVPPGPFVDFLLNVSVQMCELMRFLTDESPLSTAPRLADVDEAYKSKCIEFIQYFMSQHFSRAQGQFPVESFLELLFKFTFLQTSADGFQACLKIWDVFLDFLATQKENASATRQAKKYIFWNECSAPDNTHLQLSRYQECVHSLIRAITKRCRHSENAEELEELSERVETDELGQSATALDVFRNNCVDLVVKAADLYPVYVLQYFYSLLESDMTAVAAQNLKPDAMCTTIKDLTTISIFFGRLAPLFTSNVEVASSVTVIFDKLLGLLQQVQPLANTGGVVGSVATDLEKQLFQMLVLNIHWIAMVNAMTRDNAEKASQFKDFVVRMVSLSLISLGQQSPDVAYSGSSFMISLTRTVKPDIGETPVMVDLIRNVHVQSLPYRTDVLRNVYTFITNLFTLSQSIKPDESEWTARAGMFRSFCGGFVVALMSENGQVLDKTRVIHSLNCLCGVFQSVKDAQTLSKNVALEGVGVLIPHLPGLVSMYSNDMDVLPTLLETVLMLFQSLSKQLLRLDNANGMAAIIQAVLQQAANMSTSTSNAIVGEVVTSLCLLFTTIVEDSSKVTIRFLPDIIASVVYTIHPKYLTSDIDALAPARTAFYDLVYKILLVHWRYFFGSQVNRMLGKSEEESKHRGEFMALVQIIAESFKHSDISVFKQNLSVLESLNDKCQLYAKIRDDALVPFQHLFLTMLISKSHDFLREDVITQVLSHMILTDLAMFQSTTIPQFVNQHCGRMRREDQEVLGGYLVAIRDAHSCMDNLNLLVNDYAYFASR
ncbi:hypothetical protein SmJEL517_g05143 [Synchytrium microbalum]|uniref:Exportin-1/Importin-beta-like domain-containing protein n=1 Tax=Synchytrium microbalum TaxID=1806994 RepID=A0A507C0R4_9FUNG|nr:uncharacterized protein SmJEL517_g05143 [Synchytrium microbalum]TPX31556.1 hypothetical protein SmJEL517_g05143 [Synchytrium microbalum]